MSDSTILFEAEGEDAALVEGQPPSSKRIAVLKSGDRVRVLWASQFKDQRAYRVRTDTGLEGRIFYGPGLGRFSLPTACDEREDN
jgi:hypothetical protein